MSEMIPEGWNTNFLSDVCHLAIGGTPSRATSEYWDRSKSTGQPWVSIRDLSSRSISETSEYITEEGIKNSNVKLVKKDTVLMSFKLSVGRVAIAGRDLYTNEAIAAFIPKTPEKLDNHFLYHGLQHWNLLENIDQAVKGVTLNKEKLGLIEALLPPLPEQQKIATILSSVDDVIEETRAQIDKLKDLKTGMMQELLTQGIGHTEFKDSPVGRIPASWDVVEIQQIAQIVRGASPRPQGDPRFYGGNVPRLMVKDVTRDGKYVTPRIDYLTAEGAKLSRPVKAGTLTLVCSGTVGVPSFLKVDACIHDGFLAFQDIDGCCDVEFLYYQLLPMQEIFDSSATHGGVFTNLTTAILKEFTIMLPPLSEQKQIADKLSVIDKSLEVKNCELQQKLLLKKALMQDLLTGKVRVKVDPTETAAA